MMMFFIEGLRGPEEASNNLLARAKTPVLDRLAELGRVGHVTSWAGGLSLHEFLWRGLGLDGEGFPGVASLKAIGAGLNVSNRAVAEMEFYHVTQKLDVREGGRALKAPDNLPPKLQVGGFEFEIVNREGMSLVLYRGSEKILPGRIEDGVVQLPEPAEPNAKQTAKALRTFCHLVHEKTGKFPVLKAFGKPGRPERLEGSLMTNMGSPCMKGLARQTGLKFVNGFNLKQLEGNLKLMMVRSEWKTSGEKVKHLEALDQRLMPLVEISGGETVLVCGAPGRPSGLPQPFLVLGPSVVADGELRFDGVATGLQIKPDELMQMMRAFTTGGV